MLWNKGCGGSASLKNVDQKLIHNFARSQCPLMLAGVALDKPWSNESLLGSYFLTFFFFLNLVPFILSISMETPALRC
jgi:hypothetical protein